MLNYQFSESDSYFLLDEQGEYFAGMRDFNTTMRWQPEITEALALEIKIAQILHENLPGTKIVESEEHLNTLFLNLLLQVVTIARTELEAMTIGEKVLQLLMRHGLANAEPDIKIEDIELKQFNF